MGIIQSVKTIFNDYREPPTYRQIFHEHSEFYASIANGFLNVPAHPVSVLMEKTQEIRQHYKKESSAGFAVFVVSGLLLAADIYRGRNDARIPSKVQNFIRYALGVASFSSFLHAAKSTQMARDLESTLEDINRFTTSLLENLDETKSKVN